ncbi:hypothetical protein [Xylanimonas sp. McL0601]
MTRATTADAQALSLRLVASSRLRPAATPSRQESLEPYPFRGGPVV